MRELRSRDLEGLLQEEIAAWQESLDWDFRGSADLVRRFLDQRSLTGYALSNHGEILGYSYSVHDEHKGLIGDLYVRRDRAAPEHERRLLSAVVEMLTRTPYVTRIETQLMMLSPGVEPFPGAPINPTGPLAVRLAKRRRPAFADTKRIAHVFPTSYAAVDRELPRLVYGRPWNRSEANSSRCWRLRAAEDIERN